MKETAIRRSLDALAKDQGAGAVVAGPTAEAVIPRRGGGPLSTEFLATVATIYNDALKIGASPLQAIQDTKGVSRPGASKYVRRAREAGLLGYPARPGLSGSTEKTSPFKRKPAKRATTRKAAAPRRRPRRTQ